VDLLLQDSRRKLIRKPHAKTEQRRTGRVIWAPSVEEAATRGTNPAWLLGATSPSARRRVIASAAAGAAGREGLAPKRAFSASIMPDVACIHMILVFNMSRRAV
jgi:hypothetical protein